MNNTRRKQLRKLMQVIEELRDQLVSIKDDEEESLDNIPENLKSSERYEEKEDACYCLRDAVDALDDAIESIGYAIE